MSEKKFERFLKFASVFAFCLCVIPWVRTVLYHAFGAWSLPIAIFLPPILFAVGYGMQATYGKMTHTVRIEERGGYEETEKCFDPVKAALPIFLSVCVGLLFFFLSKTGMRLYAEATKGVLYDKNSLVPFFVFCLSALAASAGCVLWFYPYYRLTSGNSVAAMAVSFLINLLLNVVFGGVPSGLMSVCFALCLICVIVVRNQGYLSSAIGKTTSGVTGLGTRTFNVGLVGVAGVLLAGAFFLTLVLLGGLTTVGRMLLFALGRGITKKHGWQDDPNENTERLFTRQVFGKNDFTMVSSTTMGILFGVFVALVLAAAVFFIFFRPKNGEKRFSFAAFFKNLWAELLDFFRNALHYWREAPLDDDEKDFNDYVDTSVRMDPDALRGAESKKKASWRDAYTPETDLAGKVRIIYRATLQMWKSFGVKIRPADTPDEIRKKASGLSADVGALTELFILTRYAEKEPDPAACSALLHEAEAALDRYENHL